MSNTGENAELVTRLLALVVDMRNTDGWADACEDVARAAEILAIPIQSAKLTPYAFSGNSTENPGIPLVKLSDAQAALAKADARIAELESESEVLAFKLNQSVNMVQPMLLRRAETAETLLEEARRALAPFIRLADNVFSDGKNATVADEVTLWCFNDTDITFGDLRRARATLDRIGK